MSLLESVFTREYWKLAVWDKGSTVDGHDPAVWRMDGAGSLIRFSEFETTADYGWDIHHTVAVAHGGSDDLSNLQPLHWRNNRVKGPRPVASSG